ncbi:MAG: hypothetical protein U5S82_14200 [Gammaproteobacteria bacterium]|nr:hypothetical protein [Gammaproteobacteria bacterium]
MFANLSRLYEPPTNFEVDDDVRGGNEALDAVRWMVFEVGSRGTRAMALGALLIAGVTGMGIALFLRAPGRR